MPLPLSPNVFYNGPGCCGVKEVAGFYTLPTADVAPLGSKTSGSYPGQEDIYGHRSLNPMFVKSAPKETALERFKRVMDDCIERRPSGIVIAYLPEYHYKHYWEKHLLEYGFTKTLTFKNSNSSSTIHQYTLISLNKEIIKPTVS